MSFSAAVKGVAMGSLGWWEEHNTGRQGVGGAEQGGRAGRPQHVFYKIFGVWGAAGEVMPFLCHPGTSRH